MFFQHVTWDKGLDYTSTYKMLVRELEESRSAGAGKLLTRRLYLVIALSQLRNGSRIGEAIDFISRISEDFKKEDYVTVEKRKDGYKRLMILPKEVTRTDVLAVSGILKDYLKKYGKRGLVIRITTWLKKRYGFNSHSLRYAFVSHMAEKHYPPQLIAKITGHRTLGYILHYTQEKVAEELLRDL